MYIATFLSCVWIRTIYAALVAFVYFTEMAVVSRVEIAVNVYKTKICDLQIDIRS